MTSDYLLSRHRQTQRSRGSSSRTSCGNVWCEQKQQQVSVDEIRPRLFTAALLLLCAPPPREQQGASIYMRLWWGYSRKDDRSIVVASRRELSHDRCSRRLYNNSRIIRQYSYSIGYSVVYLAYYDTEAAWGIYTIDLFFLPCVVQAPERPHYVSIRRCSWLSPHRPSSTIRGACCADGNMRIAERSNHNQNYENKEGRCRVVVV